MLLKAMLISNIENVITNLNDFFHGFVVAVYLVNRVIKVSVNVEIYPK